MNTEELNHNFVKVSNFHTNTLPQWNAFVMMVQIYLNIIAMHSVVVDMIQVDIILKLANLLGIAWWFVNFLFLFFRWMSVLLALTLLITFWIKLNIYWWFVNFLFLFFRWMWMSDILEWTLLIIFWIKYYIYIYEWNIIYIFIIVGWC